MFVVGSVDPSSHGMSRLVVAIASRHGVPTAAIEKAIRSRNLRTGQQLSRAQAEILSQQMNGLGAMTDVRVSRAGHTGPSKHPQTDGDATSLERPQSHARGAGLGPLRPGSGTPAPDAFGAPPSGTSQRPRTHAAIDPFAPPPTGPRPEADAAPDPFMPQPSALRVSPPSGLGPASRRSGDHAAFAPPDLGTSFGSDLEQGLSSNTPTPMPLAGSSLAGASALNTSKIVATRAASGLQVDGNEQAYSVRCPTHGLHYDRRKASGCRKCQEGARQQGESMEMRRARFQLEGFDDDPAKRAFIGLAIALAVGFLPAAFHAKGPGANEVKRLRAQQEDLSRRTGSDDVLRRFDALDAQIPDARKRAMRNTAVLWFVVSASVMAGWYKIT